MACRRVCQGRQSAWVGSALVLPGRCRGRRAAADEKFSGKVIKLTGVVNRIEVKDYQDFDYINLTNAEDNILDHVRCFFDKKHGPELTELAMGQKVAVVGTYDGSLVSMRLRSCRLVA